MLKKKQARKWKWNFEQLCSSFLALNLLIVFLFVMFLSMFFLIDVFICENLDLLRAVSTLLFMLVNLTVSHFNHLLLSQKLSKLLEGRPRGQTAICINDKILLNFN